MDPTKTTTVPLSSLPEKSTDAQSGPPGNYWNEDMDIWGVSHGKKQTGTSASIEKSLSPKSHKRLNVKAQSSRSPDEVEYCTGERSNSNARS